MLVEKYAGKKNMSPSLREKMQIAGHFNGSHKNFSPDRHSVHQSLESKPDGQRKREAKYEQKE